MEDWKKTLIKPDTSVRDAIKNITESTLQIALVVDDRGKLLGTVTDGDIRLGILSGVSLEDHVSRVMHDNPTVAGRGDDRESILAAMKAKKIHHMPVVDDEGRVVGLETIDELLKPVPRDNMVLLMAGGLGTRLQPLTNERPKPLLRVGNRPILETILLNFLQYGFSRFYLSVNYKAEMVMDYFGDGSKWGADIRYIREKKRMGTAGALGLLPQPPETPMIVMNADLLTKVNFSDLLAFHLRYGSMATMCVREYDFQVPFGVVQLENHRFLGIEEKPMKRFFVNAGIYVLEPEAVACVPKDTLFDMPQLFERLRERGDQISVFPIREYWLDIGQMNDFLKAGDEYPEEF